MNDFMGPLLYLDSPQRFTVSLRQWISFLSQQTPYRLMPARKALAESAAYGQQVGSEVAAVARASLESAVVLSPRLVGSGGAWGIFWRALEAIISGSSTPEEAMTRAQQEAARRFHRGGNGFRCTRDYRARAVGALFPHSVWTICRADSSA